MKNRLATVVAALAMLLFLPATAASADSGGGSVGYCSSYHVSLSTKSTSGAAAHSWDTGASYSWYNGSTRTRTSGQSVPYASYGYSVSQLLSLSTGC